MQMHIEVEKEKIKVEKEYILLVEGEDEKKFFCSYLKHLGIEDVQTIPVGGKDKFKEYFPLFIADSGFNAVKSYAIIRDADDDMDSTFQSVVELLKKYKQPSPDNVFEFNAKNGKKVGIYIMPGVISGKMLEDLCLEVVKGSPVLDCVDGYIDCLDTNTNKIESRVELEKGKFYFPKNLSKAKLHAYLAGMYEYVPNLGMATKKKYWDLDSPVLDHLKDFIGQFKD